MELLPNNDYDFVYPVHFFRVRQGGTLKVRLSDGTTRTLTVRAGQEVCLPIVRIYSDGTSAGGFNNAPFVGDTLAGERALAVPYRQPPPPPPALDPLLTALWAYYSFDADATDVTGHAARNLSDSPTVGAGGLLGNCLIAGNLTTGSAEGPDLTQPVAISAWTKFDPTTDFQIRRVGVRDATGTDAFRIAFSRGTLKVTVAAGGVVYYTSGILSTGAWHHVIATFDGANVNVYLNGALASTFAYIPAVTNPTGAIAGASARLFVDEFGIWTRHLTADDATRLYNAGAGFNPLA